MKRILLSLLFVLFLLPLAVMGQCGSSLSVTDADGNSYATLKVGPNCWMQSNLKTRVPGSSIYWADMYPDTNDNLAVYGRLYSWYAAMNIQPGETPVVNDHGFVQGVCPNGWHLPTDAEITQLATYSVSSLHDTHYWLVPGTNTTGFTMLPSGYYNANKNRCEDLRSNSFMWTAQSLDENNPLMVWSDCHCDQFIVDRSAVNNGMSVRCVYKIYQGEVTTDSANNITHYEATLHGNLIHSGYTSVNVGFKYGTSEDALTSVVANADPMTAIGKFHCDITGLTANTQYYYKAFAANGTDTVYGEVKNFTTTGSSFTCGTSKVKDVDNNEYNTVQIGNQCWMKENLRTTKKPNSVAITEGMWKPGSNPVETYGRLYSWTTMMNGATSSEATPSGVQGICPNGWHVPSDAEWTQLTSYVCNSTNPNYKCTGCSSSQSPECIAKALASATGWKSDNTNCCAVGNAQASNNATGFSAVPAGDYYGGTYNDFGSIAYFWSATQGSYGGAYRRGLSYDYAYVGKYDASKSEGYSVRCLRNPEALMVTVTFQPNGAMGTMENQTVTSGVATPLNANAFNRATAPEKDRNWAFIGWNTKADGTGVSFADQASVTFDSDTTLYAQWHTWCTGTPKTSVNEFGTSRIDSVKDGEDNKYTVVQIGTQCWMKQNLRTTKYANGTSIDLGSHTSTTRAYRYYTNGDSSNVGTYGYLYNWIAAVQGICPIGWHVPSDAEFDTLTKYVFSIDDYKCGESCDIWQAQSKVSCIAKALAFTSDWGSEAEASTCAVGSNLSANNATGFSAVPAGSYKYGDFGIGAYFWSASQVFGDVYAYFRGLIFNVAHVSWGKHRMSYGFSVRCVRDAEAPVQTVTVTFQPNGAMGTMENQTVTSGVATQLNANTFNRDNAPETDKNWAFIGWNTKADGTGVSFANQANVTFDSDTTLYAQWHTWCTGTPNTSVNEFGTSRIDSLKDVDNNKYTIVQIGNQCWMKENLRTTKYADGTSISFGGTTTSFNTAYRYFPKNDTTNVSTYGHLYNWTAVTKGASSSEANPSGVQGICPDGWHVPSDLEWTQLTDYVKGKTEYQCGGSADNIANALSTTMGWNSSTSSGCNAGNSGDKSNATGFAAVPAGYSYDNFGSHAYFWSATQDDNSYVAGAYYRDLYYDDAYVGRNGNFKNVGISVRCLRGPLTVITDSANTVSKNSAKLYGNVTDMGEYTNVNVGFKYGTSESALTSIAADESAMYGTGKFNYTITGLTTNTQYYFKAFAANGTDTVYGEVKNFTTTGSSFTCGTSKVKDVDNNEYNTVQIGNQCWMAENLRTETKREGKGNIYTPTTEEEPGYDVAIYGRLYDWDAVMQGAASSGTTPSNVQGICPTGWHVPSDAEWAQLTDYVSSQSEYVCGIDNKYIAKALASATGWGSSNDYCAVGNDLSANNATGFSAVPAGYYYGSYDTFGSFARFWSATQYDGNNAYYRGLFYRNDIVSRDNKSKDDRFSVRCLRNPE